MRMKPDKKLRWFPQLGSVTITLELRDRTLKAEATPLQAAVIELFSERGETRQTGLVHGRRVFVTLTFFWVGGGKESWSTGELTKTLEIGDEPLARNALYFWANQGIVKELKQDVWMLLEESETGQDQVARGESSSIHPCPSTACEHSLIFGDPITLLLQSWKRLHHRLKACSNNRLSRYAHQEHVIYCVWL
jgi:hypothetical protein